METKLTFILSSFEKVFTVVLRACKQDKTVTAGSRTYTRLMYSSGLPEE